MSRNFLKIAWRNLKKNKLNAFVNVTGFAIGFSSCILICLYIFNELSYDEFNTRGNRIVRVTMEYSDVGTIVDLEKLCAGPSIYLSFFGR
jgi:putative ABC transport system permease protein